MEGEIRSVAAEAQHIAYTLIPLPLDSFFVCMTTLCIFCRSSISAAVGRMGGVRRVR